MFQTWDESSCVSHHVSSAQHIGHATEVTDQERNGCSRSTAYTHTCPACPVATCSGKHHNSQLKVNLRSMMLLARKPLAGALTQSKQRTILRVQTPARTVVSAKAVHTRDEPSCVAPDSCNAPAISTTDRQRGFLLASQRLHELLEEAYLR